MNRLFITFFLEWDIKPKQTNKRTNTIVFYFLKFKDLLVAQCNNNILIDRLVFYAV